MNDLLLFPCNGNAKEALMVIEAINAVDKKWNLLGFIDDNVEIKGKSFGGVKVLGGKDILNKYPKAKVLAVPGRPENFLKRDLIIDSLDIPKKRFATLIHPDAQIAEDTEIGYNTLVMAGVTTTFSVNIGNHCVILPNTVLSHDVEVGDYSLIGSNVSVSGGVHIYPLCYIGSGSKLIQEIQIKKGTLIGIGSVLLSSTRQYSVMVGNPAKFLRSSKA